MIEQTICRVTGSLLSFRRCQGRTVSPLQSRPHSCTYWSRQLWTGPRRPGDSSSPLMYSKHSPSNSADLSYSCSKIFHVLCGIFYSSVPIIRVYLMLFCHCVVLPGFGTSVYKNVFIRSKAYARFTRPCSTPGYA